MCAYVIDGTHSCHGHEKFLQTL